MKRLIMTLLATLAALCMSVSVFGDPPIDCATFPDADSPHKVRAYYQAIDSENDGAEYCFLAELVCSGREIWAMAHVEPYGEYLGVYYMGGGVQDESMRNVCAEQSEVQVGVHTKGWQMQCRVESKGAFNLRLSPVKNNFCDNID